MTLNCPSRKITKKACIDKVADNLTQLAAIALNVTFQDRYIKPRINL